MKYLTIATTDTVGQNKARGEEWETSSRVRVIQKAGLAGGNSIGQCILDIYSGSYYLGRLMATTSGAVVPNANTDIQPFRPDMAVLPNSPIRVVIVALPTVNAAYLVLEIVEI